MVKANVFAQADDLEFLKQIIESLQKAYPDGYFSEIMQNTRPPFAGGWRCIINLVQRKTRIEKEAKHQ